jgi:hypothetical protein
MTRGTPRLLLPPPPYPLLTTSSSSLPCPNHCSLVGCSLARYTVVIDRARLPWVPVCKVSPALSPWFSCQCICFHAWNGPFGSSFVGNDERVASLVSADCWSLSSFTFSYHLLARTLLNGVITWWARIGVYG